MRSQDVIILGLHKPSLVGWSARSLSTAGEVWTLNDWYWLYPSVRPDRIYQCHPPPWVHPDPQRYPGDWRAEYDYAAAHYGSEVWVCHEIPGVRGQRMIPVDDIEARHEVRALTCQICLMMAHAMHEGRRSVRLLGVTLSEDEYRYQAAGILAMSDALRAAGIAVENPHEQAWIEREASAPVSFDWSTVGDGLVPYWRRGEAPAVVPHVPYWRADS